MWPEKNIANYKKIEKYIIFFILVLLAFLVWHYFRLIFFGGGVFSKIGDLFIKRGNQYYLENQKDKDVPQDNLAILKINDQGQWVIIDKDSNLESLDYKAENDGGRIAVRRIKKQGSFPFTIDVSGVRDYFKRSDKIITDIPYDLEKEEFMIQEQEDLFPIFGYHNVFREEREMESPYLDIREADFEKQIEFYNNEMNCRWMLIGDLTENYILKKKKIPRNTCVINFDDGKKNNYKVAFPILKKNDVHATFYIIFGHLGKKSYMTTADVAALFRDGNEIGSHTVNGGSLVNTEWFDGPEFTKKELEFQLAGSKEISEKYFYNSRTFAYPLGEWDDDIVDSVKEAGYIAARDIEKGDSWRDRRSLATSVNEDFLWHLHYYKPEIRYNEEIMREVGYNGWWQFEEGNAIIDNNGNSKISEGAKVTSQSYTQSYATILLVDEGDANENSFIVEKDGQHVIEMLLSNKSESEKKFSVLIDDKELPPKKNDSGDCILYNNDLYCYYTVETFLSGGEHRIKIVNQNGPTRLDRFRIFRKVPLKREYELKLN